MKTLEEVFLEGRGFRKKLTQAEQVAKADADREAMDKERGAVSPLGGQAKVKPPAVRRQ
jgi:hypothetical protein